MEGDISMKPTKRAVVYIDRNILDFLEDGMAAPVRCTLPAGAVSNLEVVDESELTKTVAAFVDANHLTPARLMFVMADTMVFAKKVALTQKGPNSDEIKAFLETVPFETVSSRMSIKGNETLVIAINADFSTWLKNAFESKGFTVEFTVSLTEVLPAAAGHPLDAKQLHSLLGRLDSLKLYSFNLNPVVQRTVEAYKPQSETTMRTHSSNKRAIVLIGVFAILIGVLLVLLMGQ